jgi:hypothetical protein
MKKFKVTWVQGYCCPDGYSEEKTLKEILTWNLSAYLGDDYEEQFENIKLGETFTVSGPLGLEIVDYKRIE